jgi:hypothetical protein
MDPYSRIVFHCRHLSGRQDGCAKFRYALLKRY